MISPYPAFILTTLRGSAWPIDLHGCVGFEARCSKPDCAESYTRLTLPTCCFLHIEPLYFSGRPSFDAGAVQRLLGKDRQPLGLPMRWDPGQPQPACPVVKEDAVLTVAGGLLFFPNSHAAVLAISS